ncbi:hypothetical protein SODALDRAFT_18970 [Sodiomyces alkalinus F11]|uniref:Uncharacterized protein n=1 Tax=Sodiomyces alkalinus (strain CBS 110278 / VKM F-3762 / F11) TaxID=1314773 RepID=A0A3N2Q763_SODAK|nr:hypothetical protein SODALDRAFT_18970 [Sodiomyces alkalinus F11]ROT42590.1 hypothetical protein SODALDRAFT_18970 [Sodiomyces alkalinus F11]
MSPTLSGTSHPISQMSGPRLLDHHPCRLLYCVARLLNLPNQGIPFNNRHSKHLSRSSSLAVIVFALVRLVVRLIVLVLGAGSELMVVMTVSSFGDRWDLIFQQYHVGPKSSGSRLNNHAIISYATQQRPSSNSARLSDHSHVPHSCISSTVHWCNILWRCTDEIVVCMYRCVDDRM